MYCTLYVVHSTIQSTALNVLHCYWRRGISVTNGPGAVLHCTTAEIGEMRVGNTGGRFQVSNINVDVWDGHFTDTIIGKKVV